MDGPHISILVMAIAVLLCWKDVTSLQRYLPANIAKRTPESRSRSLQDLIREAKEGETVQIVASKYRKSPINLCHGNSSLIIEKSLTFLGMYGQPAVWCLWNKTAIVVRQPKRRTKIKVEFINIEFLSYTREDDHNSILKCKPSQSGYMKIESASVKIDSCAFKAMCTAVHVANTNATKISVSIVKASFHLIQNAIFGTDLSSIDILISSTFIKGSTDTSEFLYHAVSFTTTGPVNIDISQTTFTLLNEAISISFLDKVLNLSLTKCVFMRNSGQSIILSFARPPHLSSNVEFSHNRFEDNYGDYASTIHFIHSPVLESINVEFDFKILLRDSKFYNNCAQAFFGSIYADGVGLVIKNCEFINNIAGHEEGSIQGFGGALYVEEKAKVVVMDTSFINNTCSGFGGTVFSRGTLSLVRCYFYGPSSKRVRALLGDVLYATAGLSMENTTLLVDRTTGLKSVMWHPGSPTLEMWGIKIRGYFYAVCPSGHNITHYGVVRESGSLTDRLSLSCHSCPRNQYSLQAGSLHVIQKKGQVVSLSQINATCFKCKYGGICERGYIRSKSNYYGYKVENKKENLTKINFISCPRDYCCREEACRNYNSCQKTRKGVLCGVCDYAKNLTENIINAQCVELYKCNDHWFWLLYFPLGVVYVLFFMYLDKISFFVRRQLLWWQKTMAEIKEGEFSSEWFDIRDMLEEDSSIGYVARSGPKCTPKQTSPREHSSHPLESTLNEIVSPSHGEGITNNDSDSKLSSDETGKRKKENLGLFHQKTNDQSHDDNLTQQMTASSDKGSLEESTSANKIKEVNTLSDDFPEANAMNQEGEENQRKVDTFSDVINITFYFYQMVLLIKTHDNVVLTTLFNSIKTVYSSIFTFSIESSSQFTICPIRDLTPVTKTLLIKSFAVYVIFILFCLHLMTELYRALKPEYYQDPDWGIEASFSFSVRLKVATIQVLFLTYSAFTNLAFNLVNCVPLSDQYLLFIDGSTKCFRPWQFIIFGFMVGWIIPFPFTLVYSTVDLRENRISYHKFTAAWTFPLIYLIVVTWKSLKQYVLRGKISSEATENSPPKSIKRSKSVLSLEEDATIKEVLQRIEGSFRRHANQSLSVQVYQHNRNFHSSGLIRMPEPAFWQGVMIGRRLILITVFTFINSPVTRMYVALLACVVFLVHHLLYQPYIVKATNYFELMSSTALVLFCSINLFFAYSYVSDVPPEGADEVMSLVFDWIEVSVLVIVPSVATASIMLLIIFRVIILLIFTCFRLIKQ